AVVLRQARLARGAPRHRRRARDGPPRRRAHAPQALGGQMRFVEQAIERAGLGDVLRSRRAAAIADVRATMDAWAAADLLILGAAADLVRSEEIGDGVVIHRPGEGKDVVWIEGRGSDLDLLRA